MTIIEKNVAVTVSATTTTELVIKRANELCAAREKFEKGTLARSNKELYALLGDVYDLFTEAAKDVKCLKEAVASMKQELTGRNIKVQGNSPALSVFVRYVFNSDRKRAYNYTRTLMAALKDKTQGQTVAEFVESKGGVEECKKNFVKKPETVAKEIAINDAMSEVKATLETMNAIEVVKLPNSTVYLNDACEFVYVLARQCTNNKLELLRTIPVTTKTMENSAIKELAKDLLKQREAATDTQATKMTKELIAKAVASMSVKELEAVAA